MLEVGTGTMLGLELARLPVTAYVGLGANLGDARANVLWAMEQLNAMPHTRVTQTSSLYRTAPFEAVGPDFVNAVAEVSTALTAPELLQHMQTIETAAGRERPWHNAPRTLDLDLLLYGDAHIDSTLLKVPHPRMTQRAFVLLPLAEIASIRVKAADLAVLSDQVVERLTENEKPS